MKRGLAVKLVFLGFEKGKQQSSISVWLRNWKKLPWASVIPKTCHLAIKVRAFAKGNPTRWAGKKPGSAEGLPKHLRTPHPLWRQLRWCGQLLEWFDSTSCQAECAGNIHQSCEFIAVGASHLAHSFWRYWATLELDKLFNRFLPQNLLLPGDLTCNCKLICQTRQEWIRTRWARTTVRSLLGMTPQSASPRARCYARLWIKFWKATTPKSIGKASLLSNPSRSAEEDVRLRMMGRKRMSLGRMSGSQRSKLEQRSRLLSRTCWTMWLLRHTKQWCAMWVSAQESEGVPSLSQSWHGSTCGQHLHLQITWFQVSLKKLRDAVQRQCKGKCFLTVSRTLILFDYLVWFALTCFLLPSFFNFCLFCPFLFC